LYLKILYAPIPELHLTFYEWVYDLNPRYGNIDVSFRHELFTVRDRVKIDAIIKIIKIAIPSYPHEYFKITTEITEKQLEMIRIVRDADLNQQEVEEAIRKFANGEIGEDELKEKMLPYLIAINLKNK